MNYLTTTEINTYLWISGEDVLITELNNIVTAKINSYLSITTLLTWTYTDEKHILDDRIYYLKEINPVSVSEINGNTIWNYELAWRRLELQDYPENTETIFNKVKITYVAWYTTTPDDVKAVCYSLVGLIYNTKKTSWISEFSQGQISVKYWDVTKSNETELEILSWLNKYKKNDIYS